MAYEIELCFVAARDRGWERIISERQKRGIGESPDGSNAVLLNRDAALRLPDRNVRVINSVLKPLGQDRCHAAAHLEIVAAINLRIRVELIIAGDDTAIIKAGVQVPGDELAVRSGCGCKHGKCKCNSAGLTHFRSAFPNANR